eukprot:9645541-Alexandrium_andersonii.AAC.1
MSASLVGSEMCIRDSPFAPITQKLFKCAYAAQESDSVPPGIPRLKPVSYTHLTLPTICSV